MRCMTDFLKHLDAMGFKPRTVIDVGVAYGTPQLYAAFPDAYFFLFEPLAEFEPHIKPILTKVRGEYRLCALSETDGSKPLLISNQVDGATIMHLGVEPSDSRLRWVETCTLDQLFSDRHIEEPILLKTDCQGADLNVIKGGNNFIERCDVIIMEVGMFHYWGPQTPDFSEVIKYMWSKGFVAYDFFGYLPRNFDSALGQIDIAFVKERGPFRVKHLW